MKLSTKSTYAVRAMCDLALRHGQGPVSAASISNREVLSVTYLEQLLNRLRRHGLVNSVRGPKGGYVLSRDPASICVGEIVRAMEGPINLLGSNGNASNDDHAEREANRLATLVWQRVGDAITSVIDSTSLQDLCNEGWSLGLVKMPEPRQPVNV